MQMDFKGLLEQKDMFMVTGKGGVGKSTVAAALTNLGAKIQRESLLVELDLDSYLEKLFATSLSMEPKKIYEFLHVARWTGMSCLSEYVDHFAHIRGVGKLFFDNPVMSRLLEIAPGLFELAILGKLTSKPRSHGPEIKQEVIVMDSYATGHSLSMLRAPKVMSESIKIGPMHDQSQGIIDVVHSDRFQLVVVLTPEEMALEESLELRDSLVKELNVDPLFVLNKCWKEFDSLPAMDNAWESFLFKKQEEQNRVRNKLKNEGILYLENSFIIDAASGIDLIEKVGAEWNLL